MPDPAPAPTPAAPRNHHPHPPPGPITTPASPTPISGPEHSKGEEDNNNITVLAFVKRRPDLSQAEFYHHWEQVHAPLVAPWVVKHGFISYSQIHTPVEIQSEEFRASGLAGFDGVAEFVVPRWEVFEGAFGDGYYGGVIRPDELRFVLREEVVRVVGVRKEVVVGGRVVEG